MKISPLTNSLKYVPLKPSCTGKTSFSPKKLYDFYNMYGKNRKENFHIFRLFDNIQYAIFHNYRLRIFEDDGLLAGYTYKLRKNRLEEKSMYVDGLARNFSDEKNNTSKSLMTKVYEDIKATAISKKVKEITLFVYASDVRLRKNYEHLGFKIDNRCKAEKLYLMRTRTENFLNNAYFKTRKYKEAAGMKSILQIPANTPD